MLKFCRKLSLVLLLVILCSFLTACYDKNEVDDMAYVIAIGIDKGETNLMRITLQIAKPGAIAGSGGEGGGGGGEDKPYMVTTVESPTLYSALNMVNTYVSRQINLSSTVALIISKEMAETGLQTMMNVLIRQKGFRPNMYIVVSRTSAEEYINNVTPVFEKNPSKYFHLNFTNYRYNAFSANTQFGSFNDYLHSQDRQPVAILCGINKNESPEDMKSKKSTYMEKNRKYPMEGDFKAGDIPRLGEDKSETMGLAVFKGDKMVGELDGEEAAYYLIVTGDYRNSYWTFPDPRKEGKFIVLNIRQNRRPMTTVSLEGGKPAIKLRIQLEADILSIQSGINYEDLEGTTFLETEYKKLLAQGITRLLEKTAAEYKSDIFGFGSFIKSRFLTWKEFEDYDWKTRYSESSFDVDVNIKIRRPGLLTGQIDPAEGGM